MTFIRKFAQVVLSLAMILSMLFSLMPIQSVAAQGEDGVRRQVNSETGKVNFIGPMAGKRSVSAKALGIAPGAQTPSPAAAAMALAKRFAPELGVANPERDLSVMKTHEQPNGEVSVRYQQKYQGIPVLAGELIVNTNEKGDLLSMNGEAAQDLSLDVQPALTKTAAIDTAKQGMVEWYGGKAADYKQTEPGLWIFDENLLNPSTRPAELVWRLEMTSAKQGQPIRELVLINAKTGKVSLHFNQIDTAWGENVKPGSQDTTVNSPAAQTGNTWYVKTPGGNDSNTCSAPASACASIAGALGKAGLLDGDTIKVSTGSYDNTTGSVPITKSTTISGGWNSTFTSQSYTMSDIADQLTIGSGISVSIERVMISKAGGDTTHVGVSVNAGTLKFVDGRISGHQTGLLNTNGKTTLINTVVTANGRGIRATGILKTASLTLLSSTVAFNSSGVISGVVNDGSGKVFIANSLIIGNTGGNADCSGKLISRGYNLIGKIGSTSPFVCRATWLFSDYVGFGSSPFIASDVIDTNFMPVLGSPVIDFGNPAIPGSSNLACPVRDGVGVNRPQNWTCDIGAREYTFNHSGSILLKTYNANNDSVLPGTLICTQADPNCLATTDNDTKQAHHWAAGVYNLYKTKHGRNSIDNNGVEILSAVHYAQGLDNAFWNGYIMAYGDANQYASADDVAAHEMTHGVTQFESNLFYFYQSGAINESLSDLWGEYYDQTNGEGTDSNAVKWEIGEDIVPGGFGAFRSMEDPGAFGDPDSITSPNYYRGQKDNGGVHRNSGVNNKAVFLMVDGGSFNGQTVTGIGWDKTAAIYYKVQTNLLSSGANYSDLYSAIQVACDDLTGTLGITASNCVQVKNALDAVAMNHPIPATFNPEASICPAGNSTAPSLTLFSDDFESGTGNWNAGLGWSYADFNSNSPSHAMFGDDQIVKINASLTLKNSIALPAHTTPFLYFRHSFAFEYSGSQYFDGSVLEYSKDNGVTWKDAKPLFSAGQNYNGTILSVYSNGAASKNALKGRQGFVKESHGYVSSRYDLSSLAGQSVKFRWRYATDEFASSTGWSVDDVSIYQCVGVPSRPVLLSPLNGALTKDYTPNLDWKNAKPSVVRYQLQVATTNTFDVGTILYDETNLPTSTFTVPADLDPNTTYYWHAQGFNILNQTQGWSLTWSFRTALPPPVLVSPTEGEHLLTRRPTLDWNDVTDATGYQLVVSKYPDFSTPLLSVNVTDSIFHDTDWTTKLPANQLIYWRVMAKGANPSAWRSGTFTSGS